MNAKARARFKESKILNEIQAKALIDSVTFKTDQVLLYSGIESNFQHQAFIDACRGVSPTLCVIKTDKGRIFGAFTDIPWGDDDQPKKLNGNSFCYKFDQDDLTIFKLKPGLVEVCHSSRSKLIFDMYHNPHIKENGTADA